MRRFCRFLGGQLGQQQQQRLAAPIMMLGPLGMRAMQSFSVSSSSLSSSSKTERMIVAEDGVAVPASEIPFPPLAAFIFDQEKKKLQRGSVAKKAVAKIPTLDASGQAYSIGRRKTAVARVFVIPGNGNVLINKKPLIEYFPRGTHRNAVLSSFYATDSIGTYDVNAVVSGSGKSSQAEAVSLGVARALQAFDSNNRSILKPAGLLRRDSRIVERKKYGQRKARKKFQWVKR